MSKPLSAVIRVDEDKCVNCHQCIAVCPVKYCIDGAGDKVRLNPALCIGCGECIAACTHQARTGMDDLDQFWQGLKAGEKPVVIVAPAAAAFFKGDFPHLAGCLKHLGASGVFDVSFGAELTVRSYLQHVQTNAPPLVIAQPCPAIVNYIELYQPELLAHLAPADSPMLHTMKMVREYYPEFRGRKIAVISPCVAKKREFEDTGLGDYNVTLASLTDKLQAEKIRLTDFPLVPFDGPQAERAVLFSTPGGLRATVERENPQLALVTRKVEGPHSVYPYFRELPQALQQGVNPVLLDCLNCEKGCNGGTGTGLSHLSPDVLEHAVAQRSLSQVKVTGPKKIRKSMGRFWKPELYKRTYTDRSDQFQLKVPDQAELEQHYRDLHKFKPEDFLNCAACGYDSCEGMAVALHNGLNRAENCHHFKGTVILNQSEERGRLMEKLTAEIASADRHLGSSNSVLSQLTERFEMQRASLHQSSAAIEEMMRSLRSASEVSARKEAVLENLLALVTDGATGLDKSRRAIQEMQKHAEGITSLLASLGDVAEKTNLLSINASIEAAHAGNQGRGFAVVAHEIRSLAVNAAANTAAGETVAASLHKQIADTASAGLSTSQMIGNVLTEVSDIAVSLREILQSMTEMSTGSLQVSTGLSHLGKLSDEVQQAYAAMNEAFAQLAHSVKVLRSLSTAAP